LFQAEDGIRDATVTGVQTCALPISLPPIALPSSSMFMIPASMELEPQYTTSFGRFEGLRLTYTNGLPALTTALVMGPVAAVSTRSEERRVGKECKSADNRQRQGQ